MDTIAPKPAGDATRDHGKTPWPLLALLMTMTAVGSLQLNMLVPAVPRLAVVFATSADVVQMTISLYVLGLAIAQLVTGPLSDRFGRRPVLLWGFALAACASLAAIAMTSAAGLIVTRFLQAIGGATGVAIGRAIIRDMFGRERAASMIGLVASAMAIAPMVAPLIGGILDTLFGWQAIFVFAALTCLIVLTWTATLLPETSPQAVHGVARESFGSNLRLLFGNARFVGYVLTAAFGSGAFFVYVGGGPHVLITMMHRSPTEYGVWFLAVAGGYIIGNMITSRLSMRLGVDRTLWWGILVEFVGGLMGIAAVPLIDGVGPVAIVAPSMIMGIGNGVLLPNSIAGAVSIRPQAAGTASGCLGFTQMSFGALTAQLAGYLVTGAQSALPFMIHMFLICAAGIVVFLTLIRAPRAAGNHG